jgi:pimeloyl-ACP methyl ester carboxylesterase
VPLFLHDNVQFHYLDRGSGLPVVFQHGLGGNIEKMFSLLDLPRGSRLIGMDCRGHGRTSDLGPLENLRFDAFADDLIALLNQLSIERAVIGGTSMGAAVALNCALRFPQRVLGLVLLRPAWLDSPNEPNARLFGTIAQLLRAHEPGEAQKTFRQTALFESVVKAAPDSAESLLAFFSDPRVSETAALLDHIPRDAPSRDRAEWRRISQPALVLATHGDPVHPFAFAEVLARHIPSCQLRALTPKSISLTRYTSELNAAITDFLQTHFLC